MEKETKKEWTIDSLIKELNKFPKDKPVHLFTGYTWESDDIENGIFTKSYCEFTIEFLESEGY